MMYVARRSRAYVRRPSAALRRLWIGLTFVCALLVAIGSLGPWVVWERPSRVATLTWTESGYTSSGLFTLVFAIGAIVMLMLAVYGWDLSALAWGTFGLMTLAAITGLFEWLLIADMREMQPGWGMLLVGQAGLVGAISAWLAARALNRY